YDNVMDLTVSGVIKQMPVNSEFQMQMIMSYETLTKYMENYANEDYWGGGDSWFHGYVLLKPGADKKEVEKQLTSIATGLGDRSQYSKFELSPLTESHFDMQTDPFNYAVPFWFLKVFVCVAVFLIIIACINFINLATAQASQRSREIGLRKIMGGSRASIAIQFFTETFVLVATSVFLGSLLATELVIHADNFFATRVNELILWNDSMFLYVFGLVLCVTFLAGFYPAIILSGFNPMRAFRNTFSMLSRSGVSFRRSLVVFQFAIAQVLVICMVIGTQQIKFFYKTDHGFEKDNIITVNMVFKDSLLLRERFQHDLLQHPEIKEVAYSLASPASYRNWWWGQVESPGILTEKETFRLQWVDNNFFDFYHIPLIAGRNFNLTDTLQVAIVNEEAVRVANLEDPRDMIGREMTYWGNNKVKIIGVVRNYYSQSLKSEVVPHLFMNAGWNFQLAQIKIDPLHSKKAIALVEKYWKEIHPNNYFEYEFLDDSLNIFYDNERKFSNFIQLFGLTGIVIGCLGLYGLVSFVCVKRTKEISVRKVLGATLTNILHLLSKEFLILLSIAILIAIPVGWFIMNRFLHEYAYQINIHWSVFLLAGMLTLFVALLTVTFRSVKTALVNPAENLKSE
ncbi:MAG TPA: FtsX-like permease family protein, partial [Cyclobacteriaceae bacterium]|nr:FtsX-like permease family protein [Cyclobacteriaceae bacterium]